MNAATSEVTTLTAKIPAAAANPHHPMAATLAAYARAIGVSHLASQALPALAEARHLREMLPLAIAEQQTADAGSPGTHVEAQAALDLATRAADLRAHAERDGKVNRAAINVLAADTQEATLNAQLGSLEHTLAELNAMADDAGITSSNYEHDLPTVRLAGAVLSKRIAGWRRQLDDAKHFKGPTTGHTGDETVVEQRRNTMTQITTSLANSIAEIQIDKYVEWARTTIHDQLVVQRIVKLVARLAGEIAIMIASMQIAGAAVAAVRGVMLGLEIAEDVRGASLAVRIVTSIAAAGVQTVGQGAIGGEVSMRAFAENAVALSTMTAITAPFEGLLAESASLEADLRTFAQKAVRSGSKVAIEAGAGYAGSVMGQATANGYVANATGGDVRQQAFSLLVGKLVHQQTSAMTKRLDKAATVLGKQTVAAVRNKAAQLSERASKGKPTNEEALALLRDRVALLREEQALYKGHAELEHELASEPSLGGDFAAVPLTLAHLETVVEGRAYIGTRAEIDHAIKALEDTGIRAELVESVQSTRKYRVGDRMIEFRERARSVPFGDAAPHVTETRIAVASPMAERWVEHLNTQLDPDARVRLRESSKGKSAQEVMDDYGGDLDAASRRLGSKAAMHSPDTADKFTVGELPKSGPARWAYLEDPRHWTSERAALHDRLIENAKAQARAFADKFVGKEPTLFAMRGNTAAGKTRAVSANVAELAEPMAQTKDLPHRAINPDNFKADLIKATPGATSTDVHSESSMLAGRLESEMLGMRTADKKPASMLIDKRLVGVDDVRAYANMAKATGRRFVLFDVDAPLEQSLVGVLERVPGGSDPLPPFDVIDGGFAAARRNRAAVIEIFNDPTVGSYHLYGTTPDGQRVESVSIAGGVQTVKNRQLRDLAIGQATESLATTRITSRSIAEFTGSLSPERAPKIRAVLERYEGWTWKSALDAHSQEEAK